MPALALAPVHRFTVEDYYRMAESGALAPDARVELLEGQIIDMMPIGPFHASVVKRLLYLFGRLGEGRWIVDAQSPVRLNNRSEPQPDFVLLKPRSDFYQACHPAPEDVILLVEVADSSVLYDREDKRQAYARAGIIECWLVNLPERLVEVCREPSALGYGHVTTVRPGESLAPLVFPDASIAVADLLAGGGE
jgi:Uma2 family endonuclease